MRKVVSSNQVCHLWAHQSQPEARNAKGSIYFNGDTIYSYGSHFPMARHVNGAVLFTTRSYSTTTAQHLSMTRGAIPPNVPVFRVECVTDAPSITMAQKIEERATQLYAKAQRAKSNKGWLLSDVAETLQEAKDFVRHFCLNYDVKEIAELGERVKEIEQARKAEAKARRETEKRELARLYASVEAWKNGDQTYVYFGKLTYAFARIKGKIVQTSQGAEVPLEHAKRVWPLLKRMLDNGETYVRNGHSIHLGEYTLDKLTADGVLYVGCHKFEKEELYRIGALIEQA